MLKIEKIIRLELLLLVPADCCVRLARISSEGNASLVASLLNAAKSRLCSCLPSSVRCSTVSGGLSPCSSLTIWLTISMVTSWKASSIP
jgi:hypothetical protein